MTLIKERCVERACARLSAKKYQLPVAVALRSDQFPLQVLYADLGTSPRGGFRSRHGRWPWRGSRCGRRSGWRCRKTVGVAKSGAF